MGHGILERGGSIALLDTAGGAMKNPIDIKIKINAINAMAGRVGRLLAIGLVAALAALAGTPRTSRLHAASAPLAESAGVTAAQTASRPSAPAAPMSPSRALLDTYCVGCHNERRRTANLLLDHADVSRVGDAAEVWEKVVRKLQTGAMPPAGSMRP